MATTNRPNIVLTGPLGAGKTAVGRRIATLTGREFVDMNDEMLIEDYGDTARDDEANHNAMLEEAMVAKLAPRRDLVIATTATTFHNPDNVVAFLGAEVYNLTAETETLLSRITDDGIALRPQLANADNASSTLQALVDEGARTLAKFATIDTTDMGISEVVDAVRDAGADIVDPTAAATDGATGTADMDATTRVFVYVIAAALAVLVVLLFLVLTF